MKTVLVTGAAGFIGSHLAKKLSTMNCKLRLVDDFSRGKERYLRYLGVHEPCIRMDLREYTGYNKGYFEGVDEVYHIASRIGGNQYLHGSAKNELRALQDNMAIDRNVFRICKENNVKKIIFTSSVSVYNTQSQYSTDMVFSEKDLGKMKVDPEGGYGWAKYIAEKQLDWLSEMGIDVGISRIFKSYGPCDDYSEESGQVVCSLIRKAINYPKEPFIVWGDGSVERCLVYIDDLIDGLIKLSRYCNGRSLTVNMGGNASHKIISLANNIVNVSKKNIKIEHDMSKPVGVVSRIPSLSLARDKLNWSPSTSLDIGLTKTYKWMEHELSRN